MELCQIGDCPHKVTASDRQDYACFDDHLVLPMFGCQEEPSSCDSCTNDQNDNDCDARHREEVTER